MHVISASRRTDIPAFYPEWFINRLKAGYCHSRNPFGGQVYRVSLVPEDCLAIFFCTRNPMPLEQHLDWLDEKGYHYYFHLTINGYPAVLDPHGPPWEAAVDVFRRLSDRLSPELVLWRYDPIVISSVTPVDFHVRNFERLAERLEGYTRRCYFSFMNPYIKTRRRLAEVARREQVTFPDTETPDTASGAVTSEAQPAEWAAERLSLASDLAAIASARGITMHSCCGPSLVQGPIERASCVDIEVVRRLSGRPGLVLPRAPTRQGCGCAAAIDIGAYDTCLHGCVYCYATRSHTLAVSHSRQHDPGDSILFRPPPLRGVDLSKVEVPLKRAEADTGRG